VQRALASNASPLATICCWVLPSGKVRTKRSICTADCATRHWRDAEHCTTGATGHEQVALFVEDNAVGARRAGGPGHRQAGLAGFSSAALTRRLRKRTAR